MGIHFNLNELLPNDLVFTDRTVDGVIKKFLATIPSQRYKFGAIKWNGGLGDLPEHAIVKLLTPREELDRALEKLLRWRKHLPSGWKPTCSSASDGMCTITVIPTQAPPQVDAGASLSLPWLRFFPGFIRPWLIKQAPQHDGAVVNKYFKSAVIQAQRETPPLDGQAISKLTVTYVHASMRPHLDGITELIKKNGISVELRCPHDSPTLTPDTLAALLEQKIIVAIDYGTATSAPAATSAPHSTVHCASTSVEDLATSVYWAQNYRAKISVGEKMSEQEISVAEDRILVIGRCGPQKAMMEALLNGVGCSAALSRTQASCIELELNDAVARVTSVGRGNGFGPSGQPLKPGEQLPYPVHIRVNGLHFEFSKP